MKIRGLITAVLGFVAICGYGELRHSRIGEEIRTDGGEFVIKCIDQRQGYGKGDTYDSDIQSPKSASFTPDGKKVYVNSLEGCKTVVYDATTRKKLKTIEHKFQSGTGNLWLKPSGYYPFTHYPDGQHLEFRGKPVEEALTPDGRYLFVPYYRRDFDINAQDPSALAVIDTRTDEIVKMVETGPLPKMVRVSHDGKLLAITHWGDNTVGFLDISDANPENWRHLPPITIGKKLNLNYSLKTAVNRDSGSGYLLRGTVFLPGDSILLVSGMAGPLNVIDLKKMEFIGTFPSLGNVRHLTLGNGLLYMSRNTSGEVLTVPVDSILKAIESRSAGIATFKANGVKSAKVGGGARTLKVSTSGKYIFVACNTASALFVVRTEDMKVIGQIAVDSFPVGLDVSPDGSMVVTTSQGRTGEGGGNAVNFFEVEYTDPEPAPLPFVNEARKDTVPTSPPVDPSGTAVEEGHKALAWVLWGLSILLMATAIVIVSLRLKNKNKK